MKYIPRFRQDGNFDVLLLVVLVAAAVIAAGVYAYILLGTERSASRPEELSARFVPVNDIEDTAFSSWQGTLSCSGVSGLPSFEREIELMRGDNMISLERGDIGPFLAYIEASGEPPKTQSTFMEYWRGVTFGGQVRLEGWYNEGAPDIKPVEMSGQVMSSRMTLSGYRGGRFCTVEARPTVDE